MKQKGLIYSWRALAELHYLKNMIEEKQASDEEIDVSEYEFCGHLLFYDKNAIK